MNIDEINIQLRDWSVAQQTAQQITKDFGLYGMTIVFDDKQELLYQDFYVQLVEHVQRIVQTDRSRLRAVMYQIDVSPKILNDLGSLSESEQIAFVAHHIVLRELKKVLSRLYYKQKKENETRLSSGISDLLLDN